MQIVNFAVTPGVLDRTVFAKNGPLVKKPQILAQGTDLRIESPGRIFVSSGFFDATHEGKRLDILGTPGGRNDGKFYIAEVLSAQRLVLESADFDVSDVVTTTARILAATNALREAFNSHIVQTDVHENDDAGNEVQSPVATDLATAYTLLSDLRSCFAAHLVEAGVHKTNDVDNTIFAQDPENLTSAVILLRELLYKYNLHRNSFDWHDKRDSVNRVETGLKVALGTGVQTGPFAWQLWDPRFGQIADNSSDVRAFVNGTPVAVEAVYGLHRAVVLQSTWNDTDTVTLDYEWMYDPPVQMGELNNWGFVLNQDENRGFGGFLDFPTKFRSYLADPSRYNLGLIRSPESPYTAGWKYKAYERAYLSALQDPTLLLLNTPFNRVSNPAYETRISEQSFSYDPIRLPEEDGWNRTGTGTVGLESGMLVLKDDQSGASATRNVNFYSRPIGMDYPSQIFTAWRFLVESPVYDGSFSGAGFGLCDGSRLTFAGCILTEATNLSSACSLANSLRVAFNLHIIESGVHSPNDAEHSVIHSEASDLPTLASLLNTLKLQFNEHVQIGPDYVHRAIDTFHSATFADLSPDFSPLEDALSATNELWQMFNGHLVQPTVHYRSDTLNTCPLVRQVGILTSPQFEFSQSWTAFAHDWSELSTVRLEHDSNGNARLFVPGEVEPRVTVLAADLPFISDVDLELPQFESTFFGSLGDEARSISRWERIRINNIPDVSFQFVDRKLVSYLPTALPENAPSSPWTHVGLSGSAYLKSGLVVDNTAYTPTAELPDYGLLTGNYQGFVRVEPILQSDVVTICDFNARVLTWTFGIGTLAQGVFINYRDLAVPFVFLQSDPTPAIADGSTTEPFALQSGESFTIILDSGAIQNVSFPAPLTTALAVAAEINTQVGETIAYDNDGSLRFQSNTRGNSATIELTAGSALPRFGVLPGVYRGLDTDPEPRVSYSGADFPDLVSPAWIKTGDQTIRMLGRELQIVDSETQEFVSFAQSDAQLMQPILAGTLDWKANVRVWIESFVPGSTIDTGSDLVFCGALANFEEGAGGKSIDMHFSQTTGGSPYIAFYSYNSNTGNLDSAAEFPFNWKDNEYHTYNLYTNKATGLVFALADNQLLGSFSYPALQNSFGTPSVTFGSGGNDAGNGSLSSARSVTRWENVSVYRDSKISDLESPTQRFVGIYQGGDPRILASYATHAIDWTSAHDYRIVVDPAQSVTVYVDGNPDPCISVGYNSLGLPSTQNTFLNKITSGRTAIAFGGFDAQELSRTVWSSFTYSMRKSGDVENLVAPHQVLNYANVMASPDHLFTQVDHLHYGFKISSSGTPTDDFMNDSEVVAYTNLLEGTPPVPATQNLETRGGLQRTVTPISSETVPDIFLESGGLRSYSNDIQNEIQASITQTQTLQSLVTNLNTLRSGYISHIASTTAHDGADNTNTVTNPASVDLASAISLANELRSKYEAHRILLPSHDVADGLNAVTAPIATNLDSALVLVQQLADVFEHHVFWGEFHLSTDYENWSFEPSQTSLASVILVLNNLKTRFNLHRASGTVHSAADLVNVVTAPNATNLVTGVTLAQDLRDKFVAHKAANYHAVSDTTHTLTTNIQSGATEAQLIAFVNDFKKAYGGHVLSIPVHSAADPSLTVSGISSLVSEVSVACAVLNGIREKYNAHAVNSTHHLVADVSISTPVATGVPTAITLAEALRVALNAHSASNTIHKTPWPTAIPAVAMTTIDHVMDMAQKLHEAFSGHIERAGIHGNDDTSTPIPGPAASDLAEAMVILNAVKADYNAHRSRPSVHKTSDISFGVGSADAFDANSARVLSNALKNAIQGHTGSALYHNVGTMDGNFVENDGTLATLLVLTEQIRTYYNAHLTRSVSGTRVHGTMDTVNKLDVASPAAWIASSVEYLRSKFNAHLTQSGVHFSDGRIDATYTPMVYSSTSVNIQSVMDGARELHQAMYAHVSRWDGVSTLPNEVHRNPDIAGQGYLDSTSFSTLSKAVSAINSLNLVYLYHIAGHRFHKAGSNFAMPDLPTVNVGDYMVQEVERTLAAVNSHFQLDAAHPERTPELAFPGTRDVSWVIAAVNSLKTALNTHTSSNVSHVRADTANQVVDPDATDLNTATDLLVAIQSSFNAHLTQSGVHGNLVLVEMSVPNRVLYNAIKFFITESGEKNLVSSIAEEIHGVEVEDTILNSVTLYPI